MGEITINSCNRALCMVEAHVEIARRLLAGLRGCGFNMWFFTSDEHGFKLMWMSSRAS